jgi:glycosyltransferase involved in cell wall biosynthesis
MSDSKIKIMHVTFNMGIGGTEQVIRQIIENSDSDKYCHEILCIDGSVGPLGLALKDKGIHIESVQRQPGTDFRLLRFIRRLIRQREIDILHCHQYTPYFYGVVAALWSKTRVIFTEHGRFYPDRHNLKRRFINPLLVFGTSHITAISRSTADAIAEYEYMPRNKIQVIYNGIKEIEAGDKTRADLLAELELPLDCRYVGTISRLEPIKNQAMMIRAYNRARQKISGLRLILIGDGAKMPELKKLAKDLGIRDEVIFTGFIDNPQKYINVFEIFLLSSFSEGASMTLLEAMSLSKPCVVTDVGGNPEVIINETNGLVVPDDDEEKFSDAIIRLLKDEDTLHEYGEAGKARFAQSFVAQKMVSDYQALYGES